jgi:hypothetical protein
MTEQQGRLAASHRLEAPAVHSDVCCTGTQYASDAMQVDWMCCAQMRCKITPANCPPSDLAAAPPRLSPLTLCSCLAQNMRQVHRQAAGHTAGQRSRSSVGTLRRYHRKSQKYVQVSLHVMSLPCLLTSLYCIAALTAGEGSGIKRLQSYTVFPALLTALHRSAAIPQGTDGLLAMTTRTVLAAMCLTALLVHCNATISDDERYVSVKSPLQRVITILAHQQMMLVTGSIRPSRQLSAQV